MPSGTRVGNSTADGAAQVFGAFGSFHVAQVSPAAVELADGAAEAYRAIGGGFEVADDVCAAINDCGEGEIPPLEAADGRTGLRIAAIRRAAGDERQRDGVIVRHVREVTRVGEPVRVCAGDVPS